MTFEVFILSFCHCQVHVHFAIALQILLPININQIFKLSLLLLTCGNVRSHLNYYYQNTI